MLYDYAQAEQWCTRELERRRSRRSAAACVMMLTDLLATARVAQGDLRGSARGARRMGRRRIASFLLAYHEGDWERASSYCARNSIAARAAGQLFEVAACGSRAGAHRADRQSARRSGGDPGRIAAGVAHVPDLNRELFIRIELAIINSDLGAVPRRPRRNLQRCKEILDNGEDWRGHRGAFSHTVALVSAAEHILKFAKVPTDDGTMALHQRSVLLPEEVAEGFRAAIEIFRRYHAPWEETAALLYWSQALFAASQIRQSFEKFEAAFAIFDQIATPQWNERSQTDAVSLPHSGQPCGTDNASATARESNVFRKEGDYWTISFRGLDVPAARHDRDALHQSADRQSRNRLCRAGSASRSRSRQAHKRAGAQEAHVLRGAMGARTATADDDREDAARERARLMVTKRIKDVIARIRLTHPSWRAISPPRIRTGYTCSYVADDEHPARLADLDSPYFRPIDR